jgi:hypothetical protein
MSNLKPDRDSAQDELNDAYALFAAGHITYDEYVRRCNAAQNREES